MKTIKKIILLMSFIIIIILTNNNYKINVKAETSYEYSVFFDYKLESTRNFETNLLSSAVNINTTQIEDSYGELKDLSVSIFSLNNINDLILKKDGYINFTQFTIQLNLEYQTINMQLIDESNNIIFESDSNVLEVSALTNQKYICNITCTDGHLESLSKLYIQNTLSLTFSFGIDTVLPTGYFYDCNNTLLTVKNTNTLFLTFKGEDSDSGVKKVYYIYKNEPQQDYVEGTILENNGIYKFYVVDNAGNTSKLIKIYMDHTKPVLMFDNVVTFSKTINEFSVSVTDESTSYFYYKTPSSTSYQFIRNGEITITEDMEQGYYYFYAYDHYKNYTEEVWVYLGEDESVITINSLEQSNKVYLNWDIELLQVTINDIDYIKDTILSEEGIYAVNAKDMYGNICSFDFEISCYYKAINEIASTCTKEGYTVYQCISCGNIKYDNYKLLAKHEYNNYIKDSTCTESGGMYYYCVNCNHNYLVETIPPKGHSLIHDVIIPSCLNDGIRKIYCENCDYYIEEIIPSTGHSFVEMDRYEEEGKTIVVNICTQCYALEEKILENNEEKIINFSDKIKQYYFPYMVWILLSTVSIWSIVIGGRFIFLKQKEEQINTKKLLKNYILGIVLIFILVVIIPLIMQGISKL